MSTIKTKLKRYVSWYEEGVLKGLPKTLHTKEDDVLFERIIDVTDKHRRGWVELSPQEKVLFIEGFIRKEYTYLGLCKIYLGGE